MLLAAGRGTRVGADTNKVLLPLAGRRVLTWSLDATRLLPGLVRTAVVLHEDDRAEVEAVLRAEAGDRDVLLVEGGQTRHESELHALRALAPDVRSGRVDVVVLHDAARPLAAPGLFATVTDTARRLGGALPVLPQQGLVLLDGSPPRTGLVTVQTPQAFRALPLLEAYEAAATEGFAGSDTAACVERYSPLPVHGVAGDVTNIKITFSEDVLLAERLLVRARA